jgi:hypothetical protein
LLHTARGELVRDLHSAIDPSPICIVVMTVGVIVVVPFLVIFVWNVCGVLMIGAVLPASILAIKSGTKVRGTLHHASVISVPLYRIDLSAISLFGLVGAVLDIV